jgi:copper chaperone
MVELEVKDMSCGHCASLIAKAIQQVDPGAAVQVDLASKRVKVTSDEEPASFAKALADAGYAPTFPRASA